MVLKNTNNKSPLQGEIWTFNPDPTLGTEIGKKIRPCLILSNNLWNKNRSEIVIAIPLTTTDRGLPNHIRIDPPDGGLHQISYAICEQILAISKERLINKLGIIKSKVTLKQILLQIGDIIKIDE